MKGINKGIVTLLILLSGLTIGKAQKIAHVDFDSLVGSDA